MLMFATEFERFPFIGLFDAGWNGRSEKRKNERKTYMYRTSECDSVVTAWAWANVCEWACMCAHERRVKFIFMAERMGCKDGKIVVICEREFWQMVFLCGCLLCVRVHVRVYVWSSTRIAPTVHMSIDISISLRHNDIFQCASLGPSPMLHRSTRIFLSSVYQGEWNPFVSFAPVQKSAAHIHQTWDGNRIECSIAVTQAPHEPKWCEREHRRVNGAFASSFSMHAQFTENRTLKRDHSMVCCARANVLCVCLCDCVCVRKSYRAIEEKWMIFGWH